MEGGGGLSGRKGMGGAGFLILDDGLVFLT